MVTSVQLDYPKLPSLTICTDKAVVEKHDIGECIAVQSDLCSSFRIASKELGRGANAAVYRVFQKDTSDHEDSASHDEGAVVKFFDPCTEDKVGKQLVFMQEASMLAALQHHPNIVGFHGIFHATPGCTPWPNMATYALMMDYCGGGDLVEVLDQEKHPLTDGPARFIVRGLLSALAHVHSRGIVHRDVKAENILLRSDGNPVLADFGLACHKSNPTEMSRRCGSPGYAAPEVVQGQEYDEKVDIFGAGVVMYLLVTGRLPFHGPDVMSMFRRTLRCNVKFDVSRAGSSLDEHCKSCILSLLCKKADARPAAAIALSHTWFQEKVVEDEEDAMHMSTQSTRASGISCVSGSSGCWIEGRQRVPQVTESSFVSERSLPVSCRSSTSKSEQSSKIQAPKAFCAPAPPQIMKPANSVCNSLYRRRMRQMCGGAATGDDAMLDNGNCSPSAEEVVPGSCTDVMIELPRHPSVATSLRQKNSFRRKYQQICKPKASPAASVADEETVTPLEGRRAELWNEDLSDDVSPSNGDNVMTELPPKDYASPRRNLFHRRPQKPSNQDPVSHLHSDRLSMESVDQNCPCFDPEDVNWESECKAHSSGPSESQRIVVSRFLPTKLLRPRPSW
jgi:serine/threonine protein kinase